MGETRILVGMDAFALIHDTIARHTPALRGLARRIHETPELGMQEKLACDLQVELLRTLDFAVESPYADLDTAYCAQSGTGTPVFCLMAEYDALPEMGHACGHNLIAVAAIAAAAGLRESLQAAAISGTLRLLGTPGEEGQGGKILLQDHGALDDVDAALMAHPSLWTSADPGGLGVAQIRITYQGRAAHAAVAPELGLNALDAVMLLFQGVNAWRQHLPESARVHGIVEDGGAAPNIVPEHATCFFYVRGADEPTQTRMITRFRRIAEGAALMTDTAMHWEEAGLPYLPPLPNRALGNAYAEEATALGMDTVPPQVCRYSTDFGNVSNAVPGAHVHFRIAACPPHTTGFAEAAASEDGFTQAMKAGEAMARAGWRFFTDAAFRDAVKDEFAARPQA